MALAGIDPIIIFQLYKLLPATAKTLASMPLTSQSKAKSTYAIIPIYLSAALTGIFIDSESKNIDIDTDNVGVTTGEPSPIAQKTLGAITTVNLIASQESIGVTIFLALTELILDKTISQEYEITYCHGGITVFGGLIHGFSYDQGGEDDRYKIKLELSRGRPKPKSVVVDQDPNAVRLSSAGPIPPAGAPTVPEGAGNAGGTSQISPSSGVSIGGLK